MKVVFDPRRTLLLIGLASNAYLSGGVHKVGGGGRARPRGGVVRRAQHAHARARRARVQHFHGASDSARHAAFCHLR